MNDWKHDALMDDLAGHLYAPDRMVWRDLQLGSSGSPRPDVYTLNKSYVRPSPTAYECKVSKSDFRSDVTAGKWMSYLAYAGAVVFAAPAGLLSKADVPEHCGLILRHEVAWRYAKKPVWNPVTIPGDAWLKLLIDGIDRCGPRCKKREFNYDNGFNKRFGAEAARYVSDAADLKNRLDRAEYNAGCIRKRAEEDARAILQLAKEQAPPLWGELLSVLGLKSDASRWGVQAAIAELRTDRAGGKDAQNFRQLHSALERLVQNYNPAEVLA